MDHMQFISVFLGINYSSMRQVWFAIDLSEYEPQTRAGRYYNLVLDISYRKNHNITIYRGFYKKPCVDCSVRVLQSFLLI